MNNNNSKMIITQEQSFIIAAILCVLAICYCIYKIIQTYNEENEETIIINRFQLPTNTSQLKDTLLNKQDDNKDNILINNEIV